MYILPESNFTFTFSQMTQNGFENCFLTDVRHNLWEICAKERARSGLCNLNLMQIPRKVGRACQVMNFQTRSSVPSRQKGMAENVKIYSL